MIASLAVIRRGARFVRRHMAQAIGCARDRRRSTYASYRPEGPLAQYLPPLDPAVLRPIGQPLAEQAEHWRNHRFDLLGSGWVQVKHGMRCRGVEGRRYESGPQILPDQDGRWLQRRVNAANAEESMRIWQLVERSYVPIDWHLDFKSGYRWAENTWHGHVPFGHRPGVDVKVPWELARMQHLPALALAHVLALASDPRFAPPEVYVREFRNQALDFIAANPPRFGVNWRCPMDVGIRAANWLVAYDLLRASGARFDAAFDRVLARSVYEHALHVAGHLERHGQIRSNHYLADVVGLLFAAAYLPQTPLVDAWLALAVQELIAEVEFQFHAEGSNFEASTSYHRLSAELVVFATALVLGLPPQRQAALEDYDHRLVQGPVRLRPAPMPLYESQGNGRGTPFPARYFERLEKMAEFTVHASKPNGRIHQVGDNDSGRFLKFRPALERLSVGEAKRRYRNLSDYADLPEEASYWMEDQGDHRSLVAAMVGLFPRADLARFCGRACVETSVIRQFSRGRTLPSYLSEGRMPAAVRSSGLTALADEDDPAARWLDGQADWTRQRREILLPGDDLRQAVQCCAYPEFGLYLFRSPRLYLAVRCGRLAAGTLGAHAHHDQLAVELNVDGIDLIADPGTYLYTADVAWRNAYRCAAAHFVPSALDGREPGSGDSDLFRLADGARAECLVFEPYRFLGRHVGFGEAVYRLVELMPHAVCITDCAPRRLPLSPLPAIGISQPAPCAVPFCEGYGRQSRLPTRAPTRSACGAHRSAARVCKTVADR